MYASQQHEQFLPDGTRAGFLIGDGAGVGKGRTIAGKKKIQIELLRDGFIVIIGFRGSSKMQNS